MKRLGILALILAVTMVTLLVLPQDLLKSGVAQIKDPEEEDAEENSGICHDYEQTEYQPATCETEGSVTYTCKICDHSYTRTLPTNHVVERDACTVCGKKANWDLEFSLLDDGQSYGVYIDDYYFDDVIIPSVYNNLPVTKIVGVENPVNNTRKTYLERVYIPDSVTVIGEYAFDECKKMKSITIPESVLTIERCAFWWCTELTDVVFPRSLTAIGDLTFSLCANLEELILPQGLQTIGKSAFYGCDKLTEVQIPKNVSSIGMEAFGACDQLQRIVVDNGNRSFKAMDGALYSYNGTTLLQYPCGNTDESFRVAKDTVTIHQAAFSGSAHLQSVSIPNSVTFIGEAALAGCKRLGSIRFDGTVEQWSAIEKAMNWNVNTDPIEVTCTDGTIEEFYR